MRRAGVLLPLSALPSPWGIGTAGRTAREFIDFLQAGGQAYWQVLPVGPTGYGDSPYQSFSSYAGNPYYIDLDLLREDGLLEKEDYQTIQWGSDPSRTDYGLLYRERFKVLRKAASRLAEQKPSDFLQFCSEQKDWLEDYALFMALKAHYNGAPWTSWPDALRRREGEALLEAKEALASEIGFRKILQYLFFKQWAALKRYANKRQIEIIGDLPIYVAADSCDVWANPEQFRLDENLDFSYVAGCPPDGFSETGQLWGNPLFNWEKMKEDQYSWWFKRIAYQFKIYDVLRIDHFRGFESYYAIPRGETTARNGTWMPGPGKDFFRALHRELGECRFIAEDLGFLTPAVQELLQSTGFPGMKILQFAFDSRDQNADYRPHTYTRNCVVYTGTHDNDTIQGWIKTGPPEDVAKAKAYFRLNEEESYHWGMMRCAWGTVADLAIVQMQDLLGLGSEARFNSPSTVGNNWVWRAEPGVFTRELAEKLRYNTALYDRLQS